MPNNYLNKLKLDEGWLSLLTLALAYMSVVWSVEAGKWTQGLYILPQVALVALLLGFVLAKVRFVPGLLAHSFMISVGMVYIGLLSFPFLGLGYQSQDWTQKLGGVVLRVVKWAENGFSGRVSYDPLVFLVSLGLLIWISGYGVAWLVFRRHRVWLPIAWMGAILMVNLSYNPPNALISFFVYLVCSLLLVIRLSAFQNEMRWRSLRMPHDQKLWRGAVAMGSLLILLIMLTALAIPSSSQIEPLGRVISEINGPWQQIQNGLPGIGSSPSNGPAREGRLAIGYDSLNKSFTIGGPITLSEEPVLRVQGPEVSYLQAAAMDYYDGKGWIATYQDATPGSTTTDRVFSQLALAPGQSLPTAPDKGRAQFSLKVTPLVPNFTPVLSIGDLVSADRAALLSYHWERVIIKSQLDRINPQSVPDGNGGFRTITKDANSNQAIPPDLLPLIKMLKEAQTKGGVAATAPRLNLIYTNGVYTLGAGNNRASAGQLSSNAGASNYITNEWIYKLPDETELKALNLQPGGAADQSGRLQVSLSDKSQPQKTVNVPARGVYLSREGTYSFTVDTTALYSAEAVRTRFEATEAGQKIKAEIERLAKEVPGNKFSYGLSNGVPSSVDFDGYAPNYDDLLASNLQQAPAVGESYSTQARRFRTDVQSLRQADTNYAPWIKSRYLALPDVPKQVKDLAIRLTAGKNSVYDKAKAIETYLRTFSYSLNAPYTPDGRDPVDFFLFDSKIGYCVHFSSAFNVMLRSLGIPTREMTGFIGGELDPATGTYTVRSSAAHAWSQVYFPGYGWVDFEPTSGRSELIRPVDAAAVPPLPTPTPEANPATVVEPPDPVEKQTTDARSKPDPATNAATTGPKVDLTLLYWLIGMLSLIGSCLGLYFFNQWWLRQQLHLDEVSPMAVYQRMLKTARHAGLRARPTMTPYEFSTYLGRRLPSVRGEVRSFTDGYVRQRFGPQLAEAEMQRELAELSAARSRVAVLEAEGREPSSAELRTAYQSQTLLLQSPEEIRQMWVSYQLGLIAYSRRRRTRQFTPRFFRSVYARLRGLRRRVARLK